MVQFLRSWQGLALLAVILVAIAGVATWWLMRPPKIENPLEALRKRGTIEVGARADAPPFSSEDEAKAFNGFEPDIAREIAAALGVEAHFVPVDATNAVALLKRGLVDFVILPRGAIDLVQADVRAIDPGYFASGLSVVALRGGAPRSWEALEGQPVCGLQSGSAARQLVEELGGDFIGYPDPSTALEALTAERCVAFINDEVALTATMRSDVERHFVMPLETIDPTPWTIAVRASDRALGDFIMAQVQEMHRSGFLIARAETWKLPRSPYLEDMRALYQ